MKMGNFVAILLAAAMLLSLVPMVSASEETPEITAALTLNKETEIFITYGGEVVYLSFTAPESGIYRIYSDSDHDTWGDLYDSEWNLLASHGMEKSDYSYDFRIIHELTAGETYYIAARCNSEIITSQGWSSYYVGVEKWSITASEIVLGEENKIYMPRDTTRYFSFTPEETGYYKFSGYKHMVLIDSRGQKLEEASDKVIGRKLIAGETYYLQMNSYWIFWSGNVYVTLEQFTQTPSGTCGDLTWSLVDGVLTVSGSGEMRFGEDSVWSPWNDYRTFIREVIIEEGVTAVCDYAFKGCDELVKVTLPDSLQTLGEQVFCECVSLTEIDLKNVTQIGSMAFYDCVSLTSIDLPDSLTACGEEVFWNCSGLTEVSLPKNNDALSARMFANCTSLKAVVIPSGYTILPEGAFKGCVSLERIDLPEGLKDIRSEVFMNCRSLSEVELPQSLEHLGSYAFSECRSLRTIHIPAKVEGTWRGVFEGCF